MLKVFFGLWVDAKLIKARKWYVVGGGLLQFTTMGVIVFWHFKSAFILTMMFALQTACGVFLDTVVESYIV